MSQFYMDVMPMLDYYGTDIEVWSADKAPKTRYVAGVKQPVKLSDEDFEKRHEPVVPTSDQTSVIAQVLAGGLEAQGDLIWLSTGTYPINTLVKVPTQGGVYKVVDNSNWKDYSNLAIYVLKGDSQHKHGEPIASV